MQRLYLFAFLLAIGTTPSSLRADFTVEVYASPAPNFFGSPSWANYLGNAMASLEDDLGDVGDREIAPTAYEIFEEGQFVSANELIVSGFASWRGVADPAAPFNAENGNRLHFGLHLTGDGTEQFRMEDLEFQITSEDGGVLNSAGNFAGSNYSSSRVGIDYGADRMKGGGDDTVITSGAATQFIDEFVYVGVGNAYDATNATGATNQEKLDNTFQQIRTTSLFNVTGAYTLFDTGGNELASGSTFITVVPEPSSGLAIVLVGLVAARRRRK